MAITAVENLTDIYVDQWTAFADIELPETVEITLDDASTELLELNWNEGDYDASTPGTYSLTGNLILTDNIINPDELVAEQAVIVEPTGLHAIKNTEANVVSEPGERICKY